MLKSLALFLVDDDAATAVEYAVMIGLILIVTLAAINVLGTATFQLFDSSQNQMNSHGI